MKKSAIYFAILFFIPLYNFSQKILIDKLPEHQRLEMDMKFYEGNKEYFLGNYAKAEMSFKECLKYLPQHFLGAH